MAVHPERSPEVVFQVPAQILEHVGARRPHQRQRLSPHRVGKLAFHPGGHVNSAVNPQVHEQTIHWSPDHRTERER